MLVFPCERGGGSQQREPAREMPKSSSSSVKSLRGEQKSLAGGGLVRGRGRNVCTSQDGAPGARFENGTAKAGARQNVKNGRGTSEASDPTATRPVRDRHVGGGRGRPRHNMPADGASEAPVSHGKTAAGAGPGDDVDDGVAKRGQRAAAKGASANPPNKARADVHQSPQSNNPLYKTELCKTFQEKGTCPCVRCARCAPRVLTPEPCAPRSGTAPGVSLRTANPSSGLACGTHGTKR